MLQTPNYLENKICLNVNLPKLKTINGLRVCRQAHAYWADEYEMRKDPHQKKYYWLKGEFAQIYRICRDFV